MSNKDLALGLIEDGGTGISQRIPGVAGQTPAETLLMVMEDLQAIADELEQDMLAADPSIKRQGMPMQAKQYIQSAIQNLAVAVEKLEG